LGLLGILLTVALLTLGSSAKAQAGGEAAQEAPVPARYQGLYLEAQTIDAMLARKGPVGYIKEFQRIEAHAAFIGSHFDVEQYKLGWGGHLPRFPGAKVAQVLDSGGPGSIRFRINAGIAQLGAVGAPMLRIQDVSPALAEFEPWKLPLLAMLARGYRMDDGNILWIDEVMPLEGGRLGSGVLQADGDDQASRGGRDEARLKGFGDGSVFQGKYNDGEIHLKVGWQGGEKVFTVTQHSSGLKFAEVTAEDMQEFIEYLPVKGGISQTATLLPEPPFLVMADTLSLRPTPNWKVKRRGVFHLGDRASLWMRTQESFEHGGLRGHFGLLQQGRTLGWAFLPFVGRLLANQGDYRRFTGALLRPKNAPIYELKLPGRKGAPCRLRPSGEDSKALPAEVAGLEAATPRWALANLDGDNTLDPVCVLSSVEGKQAACAFLSSTGKAQGFRAAGCVTLTGGKITGVSARDADGDGQRDLKISQGADSSSFRFDPKDAHYSSTPLPKSP